MKNKLNLFSDWSEVTSGERNQLVFENLNKSYGAYEIRSNYERTLGKAFASTFLFALLIPGFYFLSSTIKPVTRIPDIPSHLIDPPPVILPDVPPLVRPVTHSSGSNHTNEFTQPVISDSIAEEKDSIPSLAFNTNHAEGISNDSSDTDTDAGSNTAAIISGEADLPLDTIVDFATERPEFPGGDEALLRFLRANTRIPESVKEMGKVNEKVGVIFIVDRDGNVTSASALGGGCRYAALNNEAIRVINKMPKWEPGKQNGKRVKVRMMLPIRFEVRQ